MTRLLTQRQAGDFLRELEKQGKLVPGTSDNLSCVKAAQIVCVMNDEHYNKSTFVNWPLMNIIRREYREQKNA